MKYRFKPLPELYWGVVIAMSLVLLQAAFTLEPEAVKDWRPWAVALGGAAVRAGAGAALDWIRRSMTDESAVPEQLTPEQLAQVADELERRRQARVMERLREVAEDTGVG